MPSKFITAPDRIPDEESANTQILIMDAEWHDIEALAMLCMTRNIDINFYLYGPTSIDTKWLQTAADNSDVILINNQSDRHGELKTELNKLPNKFGFGAQGDEYTAPMDYIIKHLED